MNCLLLLKIKLEYHHGRNYITEGSLYFLVVPRNARIDNICRDT